MKSEIRGNRRTVRITGGAAGSPFRIYVDGNLDFRYEIKKNGTDWFLVDDNSHGEDFWLADSPHTSLVDDGWQKVKLAALEEIAFREGISQRPTTEGTEASVTKSEEADKVNESGTRSNESKNNASNRIRIEGGAHGGASRIFIDGKQSFRYFVLKVDKDWFLSDSDSHRSFWLAASPHDSEDDDNWPNVRMAAIEEIAIRERITKLPTFVSSMTKRKNLEPTDSFRNRVQIEGGSFGTPFAIYFDGKLSNRYTIEKREFDWYLVTNRSDGFEVYLTTKTINDSKAVAALAIKAIARLDGFEDYPETEDLIQEIEKESEQLNQRTKKDLTIFGGVALILFASLLAYCSYESPEETAAEKSLGFHCLQGLDQSNWDFERKVMARMNDPDSFDHVETRVGPNRLGRHDISMTFRGRNAFGGVVTHTATGTFSNSTCNSQVTSIR